MLAVNFISTTSGNRSIIRVVTTSPRDVGRRYFPSLATYSRPVLVLMVGA